MSDNRDEANKANLLQLLAISAQSNLDESHTTFQESLSNIDSFDLISEIMFYRFSNKLYVYVVIFNH